MMLKNWTRACRCLIDTPALKAGSSFWFRHGIPDAFGTSVLGASVLGASVLGASVLGASVLGASVLGASVLGASVLGAAVAFIAM